LLLIHQIHCITCRRRCHFFISSIAITVDQQFAQWIAEVSYFCPRLPIILVGCKTDLRHDPRVIDALRAKSQTIVTHEAVSRITQSAADLTERRCPGDVCSSQDRCYTVLGVFFPHGRRRT
jgi:hypothetical protein